MIQFEQDNVDAIGNTRYFSLCVENVFRIEKINDYTTRLFYGIMGDTNAKCLAATINWLAPNTGDVSQDIWKYVIRANNNPGSCETVVIDNASDGTLFASNIYISMETLPTV